MKPTLFAEDVDSIRLFDQQNRETTHLLTRDRFARILARRCPNTRCADGWDQTPSDLFPHGSDCSYCDGLGFLYPDPPAWWPDMDDQLNPGERTWRWHCEDDWRLFGIVEVDDDS